MNSLMIVNDSPAVRENIQRSIKMSGLSFDWIEEAGSGEEALDKLQAHPDAILLYKTERMYKHSEPQMASLDILEFLQEEFPDVKFVAMLSEQKACADVIDVWISAGAKGIIVTPITPGKLQETLSPLMK